MLCNWVVQVTTHQCLVIGPTESPEYISVFSGYCILAKAVPATKADQITCLNMVEHNLSKSGMYVSTTCELFFCERGHTFFSLLRPVRRFLFKMLVLYETAMGYCLFKISDNAQLEQADLYKEFETPERANKLCVVHILHVIHLTGFLYNMQIKTEGAAPLHVDCNCCRGYHCPSKWEDRERIEEILDGRGTW